MSQVEEFRPAKSSRASIPPAQLQAYPHNQWYIAAGCSEIGRTLMRRKLLGKQVVLYRTEAGKAVALLDWCPHRGFRLSESKLIGDTIQCGYHGMEFDGSGACVKVPSQENIPPQMRVRSFPIVESHVFAWIWMGDPDKADPALIPNYEMPDCKLYHVFHHCELMHGNFQLLHENLLDFTHSSYLHIGVTETPTGVESLVEFQQFTPSESVAKTYVLKPGQPVRRTIRSRFFAPSVHTYEDTCFDLKTGERVGVQYAQSGVTPADERSCYNFAAVSASFDTSPQFFTDLWTEVLRQDSPAIAASQAAFEEGGEDFREVTLGQDQMGMLSRRIIARMVQEELRGN
jgi:phenylpropionate dioxygenase-like ring-hydroxylating dioxygenase large terminal subunit